MSTIFKRALSIWLTLAFLVPAPIFALDSTAGGSLSLSQELSTSGQGSEFVSGNYPGAVLMPINLWGPVQKPGIHHVPVRTDLLTLLSLAGGPAGEAELGDITIKRRTGAEELIIRVDAEELLTKSGKVSPVLEANDIILIPRSKPIVSNNTVATVGFVTSILSVILIGFALNNQLKSK